MPSNFHCSIDIETLSLRPNAAILSIGATIFDIETGEEAESFEVNVNNKHWSTDFHVDLATVNWWKKQSKEAAAALADPEEITLPSALGLLTQFLSTRRLPLWCNKAFDTIILENAYRVCRLEVPWKYSDPKDLTTLKLIYADKVRKMGLDQVKNLRPDLPHIALKDARIQAELITYMWKYITNA